MPLAELLQLALAASKLARDLVSKIPAGQLTDEQRQALRDERDALNGEWAALAPIDD